ncbi:MAG: outer membrane protein/protective antigen OMA87 [Bacteroidetes bacterium]|nr:MAG: outer membrane protein/protective antigen OMA87 [Bacteroidota bacterium]
MIQMNRMNIRKLLYVALILAGIVASSNDMFGQISIGSDLSPFDYSRPKDYEIGGVKVNGIKYLDENVIIMLSGLSVGDKIKVPGDKITEAIRKLWDQGLFEDVGISASNIQGGLIFLTIDLKERPRVSKFSFDGLRKTEADDIRTKINLARGDIANDHLFVKTRTIIQKHFAEKGYLNTEVDIQQVPDGSRENYVDLNIKVKKNDKVKIREIIIEGNESLSTDQVKSAMKETKERGVFNPLNPLGPLVADVSKDVFTLKPYSALQRIETYFTDNYRLRIFKSSKYLEANVEEDLVNIVKKYNQKGYRDAQIVTDSMYKIDGSNIGIKLKVFEGEKYYYRKIDWVGNTKYEDKTLSAVLGVQPGDVYNKELLETNLSYNPNGFDVSSLYMDDGYLFFSAEPVEVLVENDSIDLEIRIREGKQARISNVGVKGNTKTNDHVVIRELRTRPGQMFSRELVIRTTRELANLRYFNAETIAPDIQPNMTDGTVDVDYSVEETSADQIELSGGWGYGRVIGTLGLSFNNFSLRNVFKKDAWRPVPSGDGQKLSVRFQTYGKGYMNYSASFTEPWLGGKKPTSLTVSLYHSLYSNGLARSDTNRASFVINGLTVGIGQRLTWPDDYFTLYQGLNLMRYDLKNYSSIFKVGTGTGSFNVFSYNIVFGRNSISQPIFPRSGSDFSLSAELTPPYSLFSTKDYTTLSENDKYKMVEFYKWKLNTSWYVETVNKLVLATRLKFGFLGYYNSDIGVTPFQRFYLGGDGLSGYNNLDGREIIGMRGYGNETITPYYYEDKNIGGNIFAKYTLELRYPFSLNPSATIYGLGFIEAGNSWLGFDSFNPFDVKRSAGFGVRVFLPMFGILGLDWGYGFDEIPGIPSANGSQFHFSINQSID